MANVYNGAAQKIGRVEAEGQVSGLHGELVGVIDSDGRVFTSSSQQAGTATRDGTIYGAKGEPVGYVHAGGGNFDDHNRSIGYVGSSVPPHLMRGAALLLLFPPIRLVPYCER